MKPDWWETGRQLQKELRAEKQQLRSTWELFREEARQPYFKGSYGEAYGGLVRGDPSLLVAYLRSDRPLRRDMRRDVADLIEGHCDFAKRLQPGRPRNINLHLVAADANTFYHHWKRRNKELGIASHGHAEEMKIECVRFVLEELEPPSECVGPDPDDVLDLMSRPKIRRQ